MKVHRSKGEAFLSKTSDLLDHFSKLAESKPKIGQGNGFFCQKARKTLLSKVFQVTPLSCQTSNFHLLEALEPALFASWVSSLASILTSFIKVPVSTKSLLALSNFMDLSFLANTCFTKSIFLSRFCRSSSVSFLLALVILFAFSALSKAASQSALAELRWSLALLALANNPFHSSSSVFSSSSSSSSSSSLSLMAKGPPPFPFWFFPLPPPFPLPFVKALDFPFPQASTCRRWPEPSRFHRASNSSFSSSPGSYSWALVHCFCFLTLVFFVTSPLSQ